MTNRLLLVVLKEISFELEISFCILESARFNKKIIIINFLMYSKDKQIYISRIVQCYNRVNTLECMHEKA
jgi:hypothetical protein